MKNIKFWIALGIGILLLLINIYQAVHRKNDIQNSVNLSPIIEQLDRQSKIIKNLTTQVNYLTDHRPKDGINGIDGVDGRNGKDGKAKNGIDGQDGTDGLDGRDNYQLWLSLGNTGSLQDYLDSLKAREIQFRCNPIKLQNEWRYVGDLTPHPLDKVLSCALGSVVWQ